MLKGQTKADAGLTLAFEAMVTVNEPGVADVDEVMERFAQSVDEAGVWLRVNAPGKTNVTKFIDLGTFENATMRVHVWILRSEQSPWG